MTGEPGFENAGVAGDGVDATGKAGAADAACVVGGADGAGGAERGVGEGSGRRWIDGLWMIVITGGLYAILFREELLRLVDRWSTATESHGLLIPGFSLYFLYQDRARLRDVVRKPSYVGLIVILASLFFYVYFVYIQMFYPRQVMMITLLGGIILMLGGWRMLLLTWLPVVFLLFAMPLPSRLYYNVSKPMREVASLVAAVILNGLPDINAEAAGVLIHGTRHSESFSLNVAEACSGMRLLRAFLALGVAMAYLEYRPLAHRLVLLASTIPIAVFCNMLRVLITGLIHIYVGPQYATGMLHTLLGMVMLAVAFGLYGLLAWLMNRIFVEEDEGDVLVVGQSSEGSK